MKNGKNVAIIIILIILVLIIICGVGGYFYIKIKNNEIKSTWGKTYYTYLKEAINDKDLDDAKQKYGMTLDI